MFRVLRLGVRVSGFGGFGTTFGVSTLCFGFGVESLGVLFCVYEAMVSNSGMPL